MNPILNEILYPPIEPRYAAFMTAGADHEIYFEECGNPKGIPIFFIHGGPGAGCSADSRRFFDPEKWRIILHDQRGSNRSLPFGKLEANNTWALISDIWELRRMLGIEKMVLFGGSWGSTLSLVYAITYPETVLGMILRGIFLGEKDEVDYLYNGEVALFRPEAWMRFAGMVPREEQKSPLAYYHKQLTSADAETGERFAYEMAFFEMSLLHLKPEPVDEVGQETNDFSFKSLALMEAHYFMNNCFLEKNYIINGCNQLVNKPVTIIQGDYDLICPPVSAYALHRAIPSSTLIRTLAGHSSSDPETAKALVAETNAMFDRLTA